jgi:hypothetical protein
VYPAFGMKVRELVDLEAHPMHSRWRAVAAELTAS